MPRERQVGAAVRRAAVGPPLQVRGPVVIKRANGALPGDRLSTAKEMVPPEARLRRAGLGQVALVRGCLVLMVGVPMVGARAAPAGQWPAPVAPVLTVHAQVVLAPGRLVALLRVLMDRVRRAEEAMGRVLVLPALAARVLGARDRLDSGLGHGRTGQGPRALARVVRARVAPVRGRRALAGNVALEQALVAPAQVRGPEPSVLAVRARRGPRAPNGASALPVDASRRTDSSVAPEEGHPGASAAALVARLPVLGLRRIGGHHVMKLVPARSGSSRASVSVLNVRCAPRSRLFLMR